MSHTISIHYWEFAIIATLTYCHLFTQRSGVDWWRRLWIVFVVWPVHRRKIFNLISSWDLCQRSCHRESLIRCGQDLNLCRMKLQFFLKNFQKRRGGYRYSEVSVILCVVFVAIELHPDNIFSSSHLTTI